MAAIIADIGLEPTSNFTGLKSYDLYEAEDKWNAWVEAYWAHPLTGDPPPDEDPGIEAVTDAEIETAIDKQMKAVQAEM